MDKIISPIKWLRDQGVTATTELHTFKPTTLPSGAVIHLSGGAGVRLWSSGKVNHPLYANITIAIHNVKTKQRVRAVTVPVHIANSINTSLAKNIRDLTTYEPNYRGLGPEHFSIHCNIRVPNDGENNRMILISLAGSKVTPNLWFTTPDELAKDSLEADAVTGDGARLSLQSIIANNRTLTYRGRKLGNIPLKVHKNNVLFLNNTYDAGSFVETMLKLLAEKSMHLDHGAIAIPQMNVKNQLLYFRAFYKLYIDISTENSLNNPLPFPETISSPFWDKLALYEEDDDEIVVAV